MAAWCAWCAMGAVVVCRRVGWGDATVALGGARAGTRARPVTGLGGVVALDRGSLRGGW